MITTAQIKAQLSNTLKNTDLEIGEKYEGKVRDNYTIGDKRIIVVSDRISAFDRVLGTIPFKGQVLNQIAAFWFDKTKDIVNNHIIDVPDPNVMVANQCKIIPIEMVVRSYLTGSLWRDYEKGGRRMYGLKFMDNMAKNEKFPTPLLTPTTKEDYGKHDMPISKEEIIEKDKNLCTLNNQEYERKIYTKVSECTGTLADGEAWRIANDCTCEKYKPILLLGCNPNGELDGQEICDPQSSAETQ